MNILKAILLTSILVFFNYGMIYLVEFLFKYDLLISDLSFHYIGILVILFYLLSYWIVLCVISKMKFSIENGRKKINKLTNNVVKYILLVSIGLHFFDQPFFDFIRIKNTILNIESAPFVFHNEDSINFIYTGIVAVIIAPIFEELVFRKLIFTKLYDKNSLIVSIIISSALFAFIHYPNYRNLLPTFIFGIISCLIYLKTKNIIYPIILHFFGNLIWFLLSIFGEEYYNWIYNREFDFMYWSLFVIGILLTTLGLRKINYSQQRV